MSPHIPGAHRLQLLGPAPTSGLAIVETLFCTSASLADVTISTGATQNMSCEKSVCVPTATDAVLNIADLENMLASGNVEVTTTGSGIQADNIDVTAAFNWSSTSTLALDAYQSILIDVPIAVQGTGGLTVTTNDGGNGGFFGSERVET
jgi:hypothetical protein